MSDGAAKHARDPALGGAAFDIDLSAVRSDKLKSGYAYWRSRCAALPPGLLPSRAMLDPCDIPALLPHIVLHDVACDPLDFVYRLIGTEERRHMAEDRTGQRMSAIPGQRAPSRIWDNLAKIAATGQAVVNSTPYEGPFKEFVAMESLQLPLAADGAHVDMILVLVDFMRGVSRK